MRFFKRSGLLDSLLLTIFLVVLIKPLFRLKYLDNWPSIESTFIADARLLSEHLPHSGWQPLWYCGTRTDYIYPPAMRYGISLISAVGHVIPVRAYHLYIAIFYVLGIVAVYWLVRTVSGSRISALLASVATALLSPVFALLPALRADSAFHVPQRLHVLMAYGEGPHMSALALLSFALRSAFLAIRNGRRTALAVAALLSAWIVATNLYGAIALAIFYLVMVWSLWITERSRAVLVRAAAIPAIALGLSASWLTPSFLRMMAVNMRWQYAPVNQHHGTALFLALLATFGVVSFGMANRRPGRLWPVFVSGTTAILAFLTLGSNYFGLAVSGSARFAPELDLVCILLAVEIFRNVWRKPKLRIPAALVAIAAFLPGVEYLRHAWSPFPKAAPLEKVYQFETVGWVHQHLPGARVLPVGSVRFWYDVWADNPQVDGGSSWGILNQIIPFATWQILVGDRADLAILWLKALGTDAAIVPAKISREPYHDYQHPEKFQGALPVLHDDGQGTLIYAIPRVHPSIVRVVDAAAIAAQPRFIGGEDLAGMTRYVSAIEDPHQPEATLQWHGFDAADIRTSTGRGQAVLVQETWDPAWHAYENGHALPLRVEDKMGFMLIDAPPGEHTIRMQFETPVENRVGAIISVLTILGVLGMVFVPEFL